VIVPRHLYPKTHVTYAIRASRYVKIGESANIARRIAGMQVGCPHPLTLIGWSGAGEREMHVSLSEHLHRGEWFRYSRALVAALTHHRFFAWRGLVPSVIVDHEVVAEWLSDSLVEGPLSSAKLYVMGEMRGFRPEDIDTARRRLRVITSDNLWRLPT
jgi:hypothetical protein